MKIDFPTNNTNESGRIYGKSRCWPPLGKEINTHTWCFSKWKSNLTTNGFSFLLFPSKGLLYDDFARIDFSPHSPFTHKFTHTRNSKSGEKRTRESLTKERRASREARRVGDGWMVRGWKSQHINEKQDVARAPENRKSHGTFPHTQHRLICEKGCLSIPCMFVCTSLYEFLCTSSWHEIWGDFQLSWEFCGLRIMEVSHQSINFHREEKLSMSSE